MSLETAPTILAPQKSGGRPSDILGSLQPRHWVPADAVGPDIYGFNSRDERSRPFNLLRAQLQRYAKHTGARVIAVTSATPRVGKSFIACNLAASLSRIPNINTMLLDLDLRRASVAEYYSIPGETGLTEFLDGRLDTLQDSSWGIEEQRLRIFPSFNQRVLSSELLASERFDQLIGAVRDIPEPTICICDLPPVFANDDAAIITEKVDGYILVVEEGMTTSKQLKDSIRLLQPGKLIGTVLNRFSGGLMSDDYGYGYGKKSGYSDYYA